MEKSPDIMGLRGKDDLIRSLSTLVVFPDGHFHSHQEYSDHLIKTLYEYRLSIGDKKPTDQELVDLVHSTMKVKYGYEFAVLRDLGMATVCGNFQLQFMRNWLFQAKVFNGKPIAYNHLLGITYMWMQQMEENKYTVALSSELPDKNLPRPSPPKPAWLKILEKPLPEEGDYKSMLEYSKEFGTMATKLRKIFRTKFARYYMACNEPDLLDYNFGLLADMYRNETAEDFDKRIKHYINTINKCMLESNTIVKSIQQKFDVVLKWLENEARKKMGDAWEEYMANTDELFGYENENEDSDNDLF